MYPVGTSEYINVIGINTQMSSQLQSHGFTYAWICLSLNTKTACRSSSNTTLNMPSTSYFPIASLQHNVVLQFTVAVTQSSVTVTSIGYVMVVTAPNSMTNYGPFNSSNLSATDINSQFVVQSNDKWLYSINTDMSLSIVYLIYKNSSIGYLNVSGQT